MPISIKPLFDKIMDDPDVIPEEGTKKEELALGIAIQRAKQSINNSVALNMAKQVNAVSQFSDWALLQKAEDDDTDPASPNYKAPNTHVWEGHPVMEGGGGVREGDVGKSIIAVQMTPAVVTRHKAATGRAKDTIRKESQRNAEKHFTDWFKREFGRIPLSDETPIFSAHEDRGVSTANWPWRGVKAADLKAGTQARMDFETPAPKLTGTAKYKAENPTASEAEIKAVESKDAAYDAFSSDNMEYLKQHFDRDEAGLGHLHEALTPDEVDKLSKDKNEFGSQVDAGNLILREDAILRRKWNAEIDRRKGDEEGAAKHEAPIPKMQMEMENKKWTIKNRLNPDYNGPYYRMNDEGAVELDPVYTADADIASYRKVDEAKPSTSHKIETTPSGGSVTVGGSTKPKGAQELTSAEWIATKPKRIAGGKKGTVTFTVDSHEPKEDREKEINTVTVQIPRDAGGASLTLKDDLPELQKLAHRQIIADVIKGERWGDSPQENISTAAVTEHGLEKEHAALIERKDAVLEGVGAIKDTKDGEFKVPKGTNENYKAIGGGSKVKAVTAKNYKGLSVFKIPSGEHKGRYAVVATNSPAVRIGLFNKEEQAHNAAHVATSLGGSVDFTKLGQNANMTDEQFDRLVGALKNKRLNPFGDYSAHVHQYDTPAVGTVREASLFDTEGVPDGEHARIGGDHEYKLKDVQVRGGKSIEHWVEDVSDTTDEEGGAVAREDDEDYDPDAAKESQAQRIAGADYESDVGTQKGLTRIVDLNTGKTEHHVEHADRDDASNVHDFHTTPEVSPTSESESFFYGSDSKSNLRPEETVDAAPAATMKDEIESMDTDNLNLYAHGHMKNDNDGETVSRNKNRYNHSFRNTPVKAVRSLTDILHLPDKDLMAHLEMANPSIDTRKITEGHMRTSNKGVHLAPSAAIRMRQELARALDIKTSDQKAPSADDVKEATAADPSEENKGANLSERHDALDKAQELRDVLLNHTLPKEGGGRTSWSKTDFTSRTIPASLREALPDWISAYTGQQSFDQPQTIWNNFREMANNILAPQVSSDEAGASSLTDKEFLQELKDGTRDGNGFIEMMGQEWNDLAFVPSNFADVDQHEAGHPLHDSRWRNSAGVQNDKAAYARSTIMSLNARVERHNEANPNNAIKTPVEIMNGILADPDKWHADNDPRGAVTGGMLGRSSRAGGRQPEWKDNFNTVKLSKYLLDHKPFAEFTDKMKADDPSLYAGIWDEDDQYHDTYQAKFTERLMDAGKEMISDLGGQGTPKNWLEGLSAKWQTYRENNYDELYPAGDPFTEDEDLSEFDRLSKTRQYNVPKNSPLSGKFIKVGNTEVDRRLEASHDVYADHAMAFLTNSLMDEWTWKDKDNNPIIDPSTGKARRGLHLDSKQQAALSDEARASYKGQLSKLNDYKNNYLEAAEGFTVKVGGKNVMQSFFDSGSFKDALEGGSAKVEKRQELAAPLDELQERIHREKASGRHGRVTVKRPPPAQTMPDSLKDKITEIAKGTTDRGERDKQIKDVLAGDEWYKGVVDSDGFTQDHKTKFIDEVMAHSHGIANDTLAPSGRGYTIDGGTAVEQLAEHTGIDPDNHPTTATAESDTDSAVDKLAKKLARDGVVANSDLGVENARKLLTDHGLTEEQIRDFHGTLDGNPITGRSFNTKKFKEFMDKHNTDKKVAEAKDKLDDAHEEVTPSDIQVGRSDGVADKLTEAGLDPDADEHAIILTHDQADALINKHKAEADKAAAEAAEPQSDTKIDPETGDHMGGDQLGDALIEALGGFGSHEEGEAAKTGAKGKIEENKDAIDEAQQKINDAENEITAIKPQNGDEIHPATAARIKELEEQSAAHEKTIKDLQAQSEKLHGNLTDAIAGVEDLDEHIRDQVKYLTEHMDSHFYEEKDLKALARHNPTKLFSVWDKTKEKVGKEPTAEGKQQKQDKIDEIGRHVHGKEEYDNMSEPEKEAWRKPMHNKSLSEIDKELNTHTSSANNNIINERNNAASQAQGRKDEAEKFKANSVSALLGDIPEGIGKKEATDMYREVMSHLAKYGKIMDKGLVDKLTAQGSTLVNKHGADLEKIRGEIAKHYDDMAEDAKQHVHTDEDGETIDDGYLGSDAHKTDVDEHGAEMEKQDAYDDLLSGHGGLAARIHAHEESRANVQTRVDKKGKVTHSIHSHAGYDHDDKLGGKHKEIDEKKLRNKLGIDDDEDKGVYGHHDGDDHHEELGGRTHSKSEPAQLGHGWHEDYHTDEHKEQLSGHLDTHRKLTSEMEEAYKKFSAGVDSWEKKERGYQSGDFEGKEEIRREQFDKGSEAKGIKQRMARNTRAASRKAGKGKGEKVDLEGIVQHQGGHDPDSGVEGGGMSEWAQAQKRREQGLPPIGSVPPISKETGKPLKYVNGHWVDGDKMQGMQAGLGAGEGHLITPTDFDGMLGHEGGMAAAAAHGGHQGNHLLTSTGLHQVGELPSDGTRATIRGTQDGTGGMTLAQASTAHALHQNGHTSTNEDGSHNHGTSGIIPKEHLDGTGINESSVHASGPPATPQDTPYSQAVANLASQGAPTDSSLQRFQSAHDSQYKPKRGSALGRLRRGVGTALNPKGGFKSGRQALGRTKAVKDYLGDYGSDDPATRAKAEKRGSQEAKDTLLSVLPSTRGAQKKRKMTKVVNDKLKEHKNNQNLVRDIATELQRQGLSEDELKTLLG